MKRQTVAQTKKETTTLPMRGLSRHTAVRVIPEHERMSNVSAETRFGHDFSQASVRPSAAMVGQNYATSACPVFPRRCPFGGACHTCPPPVVQAKLKIGQPGDKYEREADRVAERVMRMPEPGVQRQVRPEEEEEEEVLQAKPLAGQITPLVQRQIEPEEEEEEEEEFIQAKELPGKAVAVTPDTAARIQSLRGGGQPLPESARRFFEPRFGYDFSQVRVHSGARAAEAARAANAQAVTVGRDVFFGAGEHASDTTSGRQLLAHELTHVAQQTQAGVGTYLPKGLGGNFAVTIPIWLQRKEPEETPSSKPEINYARAKRRNRYWARYLGWATRLNAIRPGWALLWQSQSFDAFADSVAAFQVEQGFEGKRVNGVINLRTWDRLRPIGEVIARQRVRWSLSESICYEASRERLVKGYRRATGERLVPKEERKAFKIILKSNPSEMKDADIPKEYWGTSAAGGLVYLGKGTFITKADIWDKKALKPGAVIQVWKKQSDLERINREKKPLSWGTSAVFIRYVGENSMKVRHFDDVETWKRGRFEVWIGANLLARESEESGGESEGP